MDKPLRVLILEDSSADAELELRQLREEGIQVEPQLATSRDEFVRALRDFAPEIILSDYNLPGFDGIAALLLVQDSPIEVPFILVSGTIGEEAAVDALKNGASDVVLKNRLGRLVPAVRRALQERDEHLKRLEAEKALKESREQLYQSQKMESIGRLAGGIAHDFNNLLMVINGYADVVRESLQEEDDNRKAIDEIRAAGERAAALTRQLLAFSRQQLLEAKVLDLNESIRNVRKMLERMIGEDVELLTELDEDIWPIRLDPSQIEQVFMNLAVNARDAMPDGGRITLRTKNIVLDPDEITESLKVTPGEHVMLEISDTGSGISAEHVSHIFEPFFTTKDIDKGTGLGLSTVYGIVRQSGGDIEVESEPASGTRFRVYFPRSRGSARPSGTSRSPGEVRGGDETILLVEDDDPVRELVTRFLSQSGYTVLSAHTPREALRLAGDHDGHIQMLLSDVVMPQMNGIKLAEELLKSIPGLKLMFMTGYQDHSVMKTGIVWEGLHMIQKPFNPERLLRKVRRVLATK